ncbi:MAG: lamin tail domain-containing protein [Methanotrichaceae archaeon]
MKYLVFVAHRLVLISALLIFVMGLSIAQDETAIFEVKISDADFNEEWIEITNLGESAQDFTGWTLHDEQNHIYTFPDGFILDPINIVKVHTRIGNDTATDLYWNKNQAVWNNGGDVATLLDRAGNVIDLYPDEADR